MMPAGQAVLISLVPREDFGYAVAVASSTFHLAIILGPMLGGVLYLVSPKLVYALVALALIASSLLMRGTRDAADEHAQGPGTDSARASGPAPARPAPTWDTVLEGLRFVRSQPVVLGAISLDLFAVLFGGATALLPAVARDVLHADSTALGALRSATAVGAACTAVLLAWRPLTRRVGWWMFGGVAVFGAGTVVFGLSHSFALSLLALFAMGSGDMVSVYIRQILVQHATPDAIRGRVSAVSAVFIGASNELGEFESGLTARWWGVVPAIVVGGLATLVVTAVWSVGFRVLRTADRFPQAGDAS
jgi:predicted MFS family arabinose efflux permease